MTDKKSSNRVFEAELRSLPVELVPPDPAGLERARKSRAAADNRLQPNGPEAERGVLDKLIDRIKHL
jgi:hypothetical protein